MSLRNLKVSQRSALGFGLIGLIVLILGLFSLKQMSGIREKAEEVDNVWMPSIAALGELNQNILRTRIFILRLVLVDDPAVDQATRASLKAFYAEREALERKYQETIVLPEEKALFADFEQVRTRYYTILDEVMQLESQGRNAEATRVTGEKLSVGGDELKEKIGRLIAFNDRGADAAMVASAETYETAMSMTFAILMLAVLLTVVLALLFTRSIVRPLQQAVRVAETVAGGDLTQTIEVSGRDEPARLLEALRAMQGHLRETILRISDSSTQLASAAEELHTVTEDGTRGLHQQTHEIEQAATAVNEMTAAVDEVARTAVDTAEASKASDRAAREGRERVVRTVDTITRLSEDVTGTSRQIEHLAGKVHEISQVLDVIRGVAEQTNLLALNAAIEAARAGEAGRGFAVVADEVRALAHRTQQSTQEIEQMIGGIQQGTREAVGAMHVSNDRARNALEVAHAAGQALEEITAAIGRISERNMVIASASEEQAQVAREVDRNLVNIRDLSVQSSAGANQTSAASQELSHLAVGLNGLIARFKV